MSVPDEIGTVRFVLPADLEIVRVATLAESIRSGLEYKTGDYAVSRPKSRRPSRVLSADTAALLEEFRSPSRLVDAVLRFSLKRGLDPETCLEEAFPALQLLSRAHLLVTADSPEKASIDATFAPGDIVDAFRIVMPLRVLDDTEVYFAVNEANGEHVALKLHRQSATADPNTIEREADILRHLNGSVGPKLVAKALHQGRPLLVSTWCSGVPVSVFADELRRSDPADKSGLLTLALDVTAAYARLHEAGVVHGDVNPANVLVDAKNVVSIIDFGAATLLRPGADPIEPVVRAAVGYFYDPQTAEAVAQGRIPPRATVLGEQYAIGVLLYRLFTGGFPVNFSAESEELMRQVIEDEPEGFARRGVEPWPQVEQALARAMQKRPEDRFRGVREFRDALLGADRPRPVEAGRARPTGSQPIEHSSALFDALGFESTFLRDGGAPLTAPVWNGRAGVAWLAYRGAMARADPGLLALADVWSTTAPEPSSGRIGPIPPAYADAAYASALQSGDSLHAVAALVALARCDTTAASAGTTAFLGGNGGSTSGIANGSAGFLEAAVFLERAMAANGIDPPSQLGEAIAKITNQLVEFVAARPVASGEALLHLGFAHGVAGILYALLGVWEDLTDRQREDVRNVLHALAEEGLPLGRGMLWPAVWHGHEAQRRTLDRAPGWCAGSAGFVHLWTRAHRVLGDDGFLRLAETSGWTAWEHPDRGVTLCCGVPGRAIGLLALYRHTGDSGWRWKAKELAAALAPIKPSTPREFGLFQGVIGGALVELELEQPEQATMPLCAL